MWRVLLLSAVIVSLHYISQPTMSYFESELDEYINRELAYHLFWEFCLYYDYKFFTERPFLKQVADAFQWVYDEYIQGRARSITVSLPPRAGKSYITSLFSAWWLGKLPELSVMRNSSTGSLYNKLSYDTRKIVRSDAYMLVFPEVVLSADNQKVAGWNLHTSKQLGYFGAGVGGQIIGFGANLAIYDDLYRNLKEALSNERNEEVLSWKGADHNSRKELDCPEIGIGTRWRMNDVIGKEIERGNVDRVFKIPALIQDANGEWRSFCEAVNRTSFYLKEKRDVDPIIFNAEYMQEPMEAEGLLFPLRDLNLYNPETVKPQELSEYRLGVIDPANQGGDDLSAPAGYLIQNKIYIHDVVYNKQGTDVNEDALYLFIKKNDLHGVRFEGNSAWYLLAGNIRKKLEEGSSNTELRIMQNTTNKHTRILAQAAFIRNHFVFRSDWEDILEYRNFIKNLTSYMATGGAAHDDAPDSCAELAKYFRELLPELW